MQLYEARDELLKCSSHSRDSSPNTLLHERTHVDAVRKSCVRGNDSAPTHLTNSHQHLIDGFRDIRLQHKRFLNFVRHCLGLMERTLP